MIELLKGVRVLESAVLFNGDQTGRLLGDLGADVIKIEAPGVGDYLRDFLGQITPHHSPAHMYANRNKRSVTLNLRSEKGREIFFELLKTADIFVDGFAGDACDRLGIGYDAQRKVKPDIIYAQCSGYGASGPYAQIPTHGQMMGALGGATPMEMGENGLVQEAAGGGQGDGTVVGATNTALTAVAALINRQRTGEGAYIDGAGSDAVIATGWFGAIYNWNDHRITDRRGMAGGGGSKKSEDGGKRGEGGSAKYQFYETKDKKFILFCGIEHKFWDNFCRATGREDLLEEKNTTAPVDFAGGEVELRREVQKIFHTKTLNEWVEVALEHDIAMGPAYGVADLKDDPHLQSRGVVFEEHHPKAGDFTTVGWAAPIKDQPFEVRQHAPELSAHTEEVLAEIGINAGDVAGLRDDGIV